MQIPGKQLFALVKRYLRVTSLLEEQGGEQPESSRLKQEFEFSMAMAGLIVELLRAMGWEHSHEPEPTARQETKPQTPRSIFQPKTPACFAAPAPVLSPNRGAQKKQGAAFLTLSDFTDRKSYVEYVQANLVPGMRVRLLEDCGEVRAGDEGEFMHSTDRMHTAQVGRLGWYLNAAPAFLWAQEGVCSSLGLFLVTSQSRRPGMFSEGWDFVVTMGRGAEGLCAPRQRGYFCGMSAVLALWPHL